MPEKATLERARQDKRAGKAPSTQAGEFVREEMDHIRRGQARRAIDEAGDRHRFVEGSACGRQPPSPAGKCEGVNEAKRCVGQSRRTPGAASAPRPRGRAPPPPR